MNPSTDFSAGRPRLSGPLHRLSRPLAPLGRPLAGTRWLPYYAILRHTGRTSGKAYSTPIVARPTPDGFLIPLPFGDATQWARNLFAAGGGTLRHGGREYRIVDPQVVGREVGEAHLPRPIAFVVRRLGLRQYVLVRRPTQNDT
jgi:deazaflavin-dependent oxidoreductase (nitroreductase family)